MWKDLLAGALAALGRLAYPVYRLVYRSALWVLALYLVVYFLMNSSRFRDTFEDLLGSAIPGRMEAASWHWGPLPWNGGAIDFRIIHPDGHPVIEAGWADGDIDLGDLLSWIFHGAILGQETVRLHVTRGEAHDFRLRLDFDDEHDLALIRAFERPDPPGYVEPPDDDDDDDDEPVTVRVSNATAVNGTVEIRFPDWTLDVDVEHAQADLQVRDGLRLASRFVSVRRGRGHIPLPPGPDGEPRVLEPELGRTLVHGFRFDRHGFDFDSVRATLERSVTLHAVGGMDFEDAPAFAGSARVEVAAIPDVLRVVTGDSLEGPLSVVVRGSGRFDDVTADAVVRSPRLVVDGLPFEDLGVRLGLARRSLAPGLRPYELRVDGAEARLREGRVRLADASYRVQHVAAPPQGPPGFLPVGDAFQLSLWTQTIDVHALTERYLEELPPPLAGAVTGHVHLRGGRFVGGDGPFWQVVAQLAAGVAWKADASWPLAANWDVTGELAYLERVLPEDGGPVPEDMRDVVVLRDVSLRSGGDRLRVHGGLSLADGRLAGAAGGSFAKLSRLLGPLGFAGVEGRLRTLDVKLGGRLTAPVLEARIALTDLLAERQRWGDLSLTAKLTHDKLRVRSLEADGDWGRLEGRGSLAARSGPVWAALESGAGRFQLERLRLHDIALERFLPGGRVSGLGEVSLDGLSGDLRDPLGTLRGRGKFSARNVRAGGQRLRRVEGLLTADAKTVGLREVKAWLPRGGHLDFDLALEKRRDAMRLDLHLDPLPLRTFAAFLGRELPYDARAGIDLRVTGRPSDPAVEGTLTLRSARVYLPGGDRARADEGEREKRTIRLGDARVQLLRAAGGDLELTAEEFFPGFELRPGSHIAFRRGMPERLALSIAAVDYDPTPFWAGAADVELTAAVSALAAIRYDFSPRGGQDRWGVELTAPARGLHLRLQGRKLELINPTPLEVSIGPGGLAIPEALLSGSDGSALVLCGSISDWRTVDMAVGGALTAEPLRLLFRRTFSRLEGRARITGDEERRPAVCRSGSLWELGGALVARGPLATPDVLGRLELSDVRVQPRGFGREFVQQGAAVVRVAPLPPKRGKRRDEDGGLKLTLARDEALEVTLDEGAFTLWGDTTLRGFRPQTGAFEFNGTDLYYTSPKTANATFNPRLTFTFSDLDDPRRRESRLGGDIVITEGAYYRSFDRLARAFGGALDREQSTPTRSITQMFPSLADTALDIRVRGGGFGVTSGFTFGTTDLQLRIALGIRGTLADPLIFDRIEILPGGLITYKVVRREFEVTRGTLDFRGNPSRPFLDLEARTEIEYYEGPSGSSLSTVDSPLLDDEERIVTIKVRVQGQYPDIDLDLSTDNRGYDQADLQSFLLTGAPRTIASGARSSRSINLFTDDIADLARKMLLSAFVDAITLGVTPEGGIDWGVIASLGRNLKLRTRVVQEGTDQKVRARFEFRVSEHLSLEGQLKMNEEGDESIRTYESKLRYRIPLD